MLSHNQSHRVKRRDQKVFHFPDGGFLFFCLFLFFDLRIIFGEQFRIRHCCGAVLLMRPSNHDVCPVGCSLNSESYLAAQTARRAKRGGVIRPKARCFWTVIVDNNTSLINPFVRWLAGCCSLYTLADSCGFTAATVLRVFCCRLATKTNTLRCNLFVFSLKCCWCHSSLRMDGDTKCNEHVSTRSLRYLHQ